MCLAVCEGWNLNNTASAGQADTAFRLLQGETLTCIQQQLVKQLLMHSLPCCAFLCHSVSIHRMFGGPFNALTIYSMLYHLLLCCAVLCCAVLCCAICAMLRHSMLCCINLLCCVTPCHAMSYFAMLLHFQTSWNNLCHSVAICDVLCHSMQYFVVLVALYNAVHAYAMLCMLCPALHPLPCCAIPPLHCCAI